MTQEEMPKFSVLMPVYHGDDPDVFRRAISSVLSNTRKPDQLVLVVDGQIPATLEAVILEFSSDLTDVVRMPVNRGIAVALNRGLNHCQYEIIARCDADDVNLEHRFEVQLKQFMLNKNLDLCGALAIECSAEGKAIRKLPMDESAIKSFARYRNPFNHMTVMFRRSSVMSCDKYPLIPFREDYGLWAKMLGAGMNVVNINQVLVHASGGPALYKRRGGMVNLFAELDLQLLLLSSGISRPHNFVIALFIRGLNLIIPTILRRLIYENFFRKKEEH